MKSIKTLTAGLLALAFAGTVSAQTTIHISGAATYRPPVQQAIGNILQPGYTFAYNGSSSLKPNASVYHGFLKSTGNPEVYIETYWTGDVSGVVDLSQRNILNHWLSHTAYTLTTSGTAVGTTNPISYSLDTAAAPDASVSVSFYQSSAAAVYTAGAAGRTASAAILGAGLKDAGSSGKAGTAGKLGIAPFQWVLGRLSGTNAQPFSNITTQNASTLIENGYAPVAEFTGTSSDKFNYVFLVGRSEDAGARTVPFAEAQNGWTGKNGFGQAPQQYRLTFSGSNLTVQSDGVVTGGTNGTVTGFYLWPDNSPLNTATSINWNTYGHSGYNLTSDLANALSAADPITTGTIGNPSDPNDPTPLPTGISGAYFIGYNGVADTSTVTNAGGKALTYNGVTYSAAAVQNGQYSLWSYAHLFVIGSGANALTGVALQAVNDLADQIWSADATTSGAGILISSSSAPIYAKRPGVEGTPIIPNY